jgi:WhiB family transcriptional regulator, redox-sensing transcriptional regulator
VNPARAVNHYAEVPAPGSWTKRAACRDGHLYYEFFRDGPPLRAVRELCESCPVSSQCLSYALANDVHGIWAGTTWKDRQRTRGRRWRM